MNLINLLPKSKIIGKPIRFHQKLNENNLNVNRIINYLKFRELNLLDLTQNKLVLAIK